MLRIYVWVGGRGCVGHEHLLRLLVWVQWGNKAMEGARLVLCPLCTVKKQKQNQTPKNLNKRKKKKKKKKHQISSPQNSPNIQSSLTIGWDQGRKR